MPDGQIYPPVQMNGPPRWEHQKRILARSADAEYYALLMEQRTGKTPVLIDTAAHLWCHGKIDALILIAPNGVHADFIQDYIPQYMPRDIPRMTYTWRSSKAQQTASKEQQEALLTTTKLAIIAINIDAIITPYARKYLARFLKTRRCLTAIDESLDISSPSAKRTKVAWEIGKRSAYRRILDGTAADAGPMGLYAQAEFLKPALLGFRSFWAFKQRYAEWETNYTSGQAYQTIKSYQNLPELQAKLASFSSRVLREECTDMPAKVYKKRSFELTSEQRRVYDALKKEYSAELDDGRQVTAAIVLTRYLRLQQVASNFLPSTSTLIECPDCRASMVECPRCEGIGYVVGPDLGPQPISASNPRIDALAATIAQLRPSEQCVIWSRFIADRTNIAAWASGAAISHARYDGSTSTDDRRLHYDGFRDGKIRLFISDPRAAGRGLDLSKAGAVIYYSHDWSLRFRRQSEDRAQNLQKKDATLYVDIIAADTVDQSIVKALREGADLAAQIMGDPQRKWL